MALIDWGYKRRYYTATSNWYVNGSSPSRWSYTSVAQSGENQPEMCYVGQHGLTSSKTSQYSEGNLVWKDTRKFYCDAVYLKFDIPASACESAGLRLYFPAQNNAVDLYCQRMTQSAEAAGDSYPTTSEDNAITFTVPKDGGWIELDVTALVNDAITAGEWFGLLIGQVKVNNERKTILTFSQIEFAGAISGGMFDVMGMVSGAFKEIIGAKILVGRKWKMVNRLKVMVGHEWKI